MERRGSNRGNTTQNCPEGCEKTSKPQGSCCRGRDSKGIGLEHDFHTKVLVKTFCYIRGLLEKYPTFGREKETGLLGALDT